MKTRRRRKKKCSSSRESLATLNKLSTLLFLLLFVEKVFIESSEKKRKKKKRTTTHERTEFLQHVLSLSLVVVVFFIVPDLHVQRPGAVLREIRVVFMYETKVVTQMETKT